MIYFCVLGPGASEEPLFPGISAAGAHFIMSGNFKHHRSRRRSGGEQDVPGWEEIRIQDRPSKTLGESGYRSERTP